MIKINKYIFGIIFLFTAGCQQLGQYDYSTPEGTFKTYVRQIDTLRIIADTSCYRRVIRCFDKKDIEWFEKNYELIDYEREDYVYPNLYETKKKAYAFGRTISPIGPPREHGEMVFSEISPTETELSINGYAEKIRFIKKKNSWVITGFFGAREKLSLKPAK